MTQEIPLFNSSKVTLVDDEDFNFLSQWRWRRTEPRPGYVYAARSKRIASDHWRVVFMHREILRPPSGMVVDHINHNGLDNRKSNLRLATHAQNRANKRGEPASNTGYWGVSLHIARGDYIAHIGHDGELIHLGYFDDPIEAARAYDKAALDLLGEFATLNFSLTG